MPDMAPQTKTLVTRVLQILEADHNIKAFGVPGNPEETRFISRSLLGNKEPDQEFARVLAGKLAEDVREETGDSGYSISDWEVAESDHADCEDANGKVLNAFVQDRRCYRINLTLVPTDLG